MWKMLVGFIVFAAIVVFVLMKTDANIDMGGEKHGIETTSESHDNSAAAPSTSAASEAAPTASAAASEAASAASN